jgi:cation diffusion facilitator family transporter
MFQFIVKTFIKDYQNTSHHKVREQYGTMCSILSIICNSIMVIFKLLFGFIINSAALLADGFNNLSDVGSNLATLFGFKLAGKHPDYEHPYGHGRYEYIAGLIISFLILLVGFSSLKESVLKTINPSPVLFEINAVIVIIVSIFIKLWMYYFNNKAGQLIDSASLKAAAQDSLNDVLSTSATLLSIIIGLFVDLPVDGIIGIIVSLIVLKSGIDIFRETVNPLLGNVPDKELVKEIYDYVLSFDKALGIHDFMLHDYGPSRRYASLHVEVDCDENIVDIHEEIDKIERGVLNNFHVFTTIHYDPIDIHNEQTILIKEKVQTIVKQINNEYSIHDFRVVYGKQNTNLIFDVVIPSSDETKHSIIRKEIEQKVKEISNEYSCVIQVEHSFV